MLIAVTKPEIKQNILKKLPKSKFEYVSYIHPSALYSEFSSIGSGCIIGPYAILTGNVELDDFVYVSYNSVIGHDTRVKSFSTIYPYVEICGNCKIGKGCVFGISSYVLPGTSMGDASKLDAGSILRESCDSRCFMRGNPAKLISKRLRSSTYKYRLFFAHLLATQCTLFAHLLIW